MPTNCPSPILDERLVYISTSFAPNFPEFTVPVIIRARFCDGRATHTATKKLGQGHDGFTIVHSFGDQEVDQFKGWIVRVDVPGVNVWTPHGTITVWHPRVRQRFDETASAGIFLNEWRTAAKA